jgi:hypothetical protein
MESLKFLVTYFWIGKDKFLGKLDGAHLSPPSYKQAL